MTSLFPTILVDGVDIRVVRAAERFVAASQALADRSFWPLRIFANANLFLWHLDVFAGVDDPVPAMEDVFGRATAFLDKAATGGVGKSQFPPPVAEGQDPDADTGPLFRDVYAPVSDHEYFDEAYDVLRTRLERNDIDPVGLFGGKVVLDAGCGIGKYANAMARFGAARVIGIDLTAQGIAEARARTARVGGERPCYCVGSVVNIPVPDCSVDVAWCNSVLHLIDQPERGIRELARILKPGGRVFIYVNGRMGLLELLVKALHAANQGIPRHLFQHFLAASGMNPGRVAWLVGFTFANYRFLPQADVEAMLVGAGLTIESRLNRGIPTDYSDLVAAGLPHGRVKYGEAKLNYLARKL